MSISIFSIPVAGLAMVATAVLAMSARAGADFPDVDKLPARPELPDPLVFLDGQRVATVEEWFTKRRPELKLLFQHYMYGTLPAAPGRISAKIEHEDSQALDGKATLREIALSYGPAEAPPIHLLMVVPNRRRGPVGVFVGMNFSGNHTLVKDSAVRLPTVWMYPGPGVENHRATEDGRGKDIDVWALEQSIDRGYAVATFYNGDIDPDDNNVRGGIQPYLHAGTDKHQPQDWGTIALWAWGISRAVDYLVTDPSIDAKRIAVVGHSRLGKTALLAAAFDERIALAIPLQAGCGGTAPSRGQVGESVKQINERFPHWFNDTFKQFNARPDRLPFDQNCLVALVAPRPVLFANAVEDKWANPEGQFEVLRAADPVYRFLGVDGLGARKMPEVGQLINSRLGYFIRPGQHSMTRDDWRVFLDFADQHLGETEKKGVSLFDGKTFDGWDGDTKETWRIEDGCIVGGSLTKKIPHNEFLATKKSYADFTLQLKFKLQGDSKKTFVNSGVQFRSQRVPNDAEMTGYQADLGDPSWWGCIYDESRRNKVLAQTDMAKLDKVLHRNDWNDYEIRAEGRRMRTYINGVLCVDFTEKDEKIPQSGRIGLQIHGGGPAQVWFKDITILEQPAK